MNIKEITTEAVMALDPRYSEARVAELLAQPNDNDNEVFEMLDSIPFDDARWFIANALPKPERVQWAQACARRAKYYAEGAVAYWAVMVADFAADAAADTAADTAAYYAARAAYWATRVAKYAGGKDAQRAEQHLAIRHGLTLLGAL